jgi:hypothetical protein
MLDLQIGEKVLKNLPIKFETNCKDGQGNVLLEPAN